MTASKRTTVAAALPRLAVAILCAGWLSGIAPAGADDDFFTHLHTDKMMANVTVSPGRAGPVEIGIQLETPDELPLAAKTVAVTLTDAAGRRLETVQAIRGSGERWLVKTSLAAGRWMLGLGIALSDADTVKVEAPILIAADAGKSDDAPMTNHHHH